MQLFNSALLALGLGLLSVPLPAVPLQDLISTGGSLTSGDKVFTGFTYSTTGVDMPNAANVDVVPILLAGNYGLRFVGTFHANQGNPVSTAFIQYTVSVLSGVPQIVDVHLDGDPTVTGTAGHISAQMSVSDTVHGVVAVPILRIFDDLPGGQVYNDFRLTNAVTNLPYASLNVQTTITASAEAGTVSQMGHFEETFSQVPEPGSLVLLLGGGLLLALGRSGRRS